MSKITVPNKNGKCVANEDCTVKTPYGLISGKKCAIGNKAYHNTTVDGAVAIAKSGALKVAQYPGVLGTNALSLSGCHTQAYGGNVKFVLKSSKKIVPTCYYDFNENKEADRGIDKEAHEKTNGENVGLNRVRSKYGVNISMYKKECEYVSDKDIPLKPNLEKVEYWIPWRADKNSYDHRCEGTGPSHANVNGYEQGVKVIRDQIERVNEAANTLGVPFEVKSCFSAIKTGYGDQYIPLNEENLKKLAQGIRPKIVDGKIPDKCIC